MMEGKEDEDEEPEFPCCTTTIMAINHKYDVAGAISERRVTTTTTTTITKEEEGKYKGHMQQQEVGGVSANSG